MSEKKPSIVRKYISPVGQSIMRSLAFRTNCFTTFIGNLVYLIIIYYLWKAIFASVGTAEVCGMTFHETMVYLVLASAMYNFMNCWITYNLGEEYISGEIIIDLIKPMDFQVYYFVTFIGRIIVNFVISFLPTFAIVLFIAKNDLILGGNLVFYFVSIFIGIVINFGVDFFVGLICFYTESVWGINTMKDVLVALLSGATVPLAFFPSVFRKIVDFLPFQAIYNAPLEILTNPKLTTLDYCETLIRQFAWAVVMILLCRIFWAVAKKRITVNGG